MLHFHALFFCFNVPLKQGKSFKSSKMDSLLSTVNPATNDAGSSFILYVLNNTRESRLSGLNDSPEFLYIIHAILTPHFKRCEESQLFVWKNTQSSDSPL
jgi:hypothetical protein